MRICLRRFVFMFLVLGLATFGSSAARRDRLIRQFNKHILNPGALWIVARRRMYYGVMHHVGRRSGRMYSTPVVAKPRRCVSRPTVALGQRVFVRARTICLDGGRTNECVVPAVSCAFCA